MNDLELRKHLSKLEKSKEKAEKALSSLQDDLDGFNEIRDIVYRTVQDMRESHTKTQKAIKNMEQINKYRKSIEGKIETKEKKIRECDEDIISAERNL